LQQNLKYPTLITCYLNIKYKIEIKKMSM